jgi:hypothetical protein
MSDTYCQFSEGVFGLTDEEQAWIRRMLEFEDPGEDEDPFIPFVKRRYGEDDWGLDFLGFDWSIEPTESGPWLWIRAAESGSPERASAFLQLFLQKFRPDKYLLLRFAVWSTGLLLGGFCGGVAVITAEEVKMFDDSQAADHAEALPLEYGGY